MAETTRLPDGGARQCCAFQLLTCPRTTAPCVSREVGQVTCTSWSVQSASCRRLDRGAVPRTGSVGVMNPRLKSGACRSPFRPGDTTATTLPAARKPPTFGCMTPALAQPPKPPCPRRNEPHCSWLDPKALTWCRIQHHNRQTLCWEGAMALTGAPGGVPWPTAIVPTVSLSERSSLGDPSVGFSQGQPAGEHG